MKTVLICSPSGEGSRPRRRYCPFRVRFADETLQDTALRYWERNRAGGHTAASGTVEIPENSSQECRGHRLWLRVLREQGRPTTLQRKCLYWPLQTMSRCLSRTNRVPEGQQRWVALDTWCQGNNGCPGLVIIKEPVLTHPSLHSWFPSPLAASGIIFLIDSGGQADQMSSKP